VGRGRKKKVTTADIYDIAVGELGLRKEEFERMTWGEFQCRYMGHIRRGYERWDMARHIMYYAASPYLKKGTTPEKILPLPTDKKKKSEAMTKERFKELKEKWLNVN